MWCCFSTSDNSACSQCIKNLKKNCKDNRGYSVYSTLQSASSFFVLTYSYAMPLSTKKTKNFFEIMSGWNNLSSPLLWEVLVSLVASKIEIIISFRFFLFSESSFQMKWALHFTMLLLGQQIKMTSSLKIQDKQKSWYFEKKSSLVHCVCLNAAGLVAQMRSNWEISFILMMMLPILMH